MKAKKNTVTVTDQFGTRAEIPNSPELQKGLAEQDAEHKKIQARHHQSGKANRTNVGVPTGTSGLAIVPSAKVTPEVAPKVAKSAVKASAKGAAPVPAAKAPKVYPVCKCGCLDETGQPARTRGGEFRPGHDARFYARQNGHPQKMPSTGNHLVDTVLGLCRKMDEKQRELFRATFEQRFAVKS